MTAIIILLAIIALAVAPQAILNFCFFLESLIVLALRVGGVIGCVGFFVWLVLRHYA